MQATTPKDRQSINWDAVVQQIFDMIKTNTAIINRYGIVLASNIPEFAPKSLIPPPIWDLVQLQAKIAAIRKNPGYQNVILNGDHSNLIVSLGKFITLITEAPRTLDLNQFVLSISRILITMDKSSEKPLVVRIQPTNLAQDFVDLHDQTTKAINKDRTPIFRHIIPHITKKD